MTIAMAKSKDNSRFFIFFVPLNVFCLRIVIIFDSFVKRKRVFIFIELLIPLWCFFFCTGSFIEIYYFLKSVIILAVQNDEQCKLRIFAWRSLSII